MRAQRLRLVMTLSETAPEVRREVILDADLPLSMLHRVIQRLFGWDEAQPAEFHTSPPRGPILVRSAPESEDSGGLGASSRRLGIAGPGRAGPPNAAASTAGPPVDYQEVEVGIAEPEEDPGPPLPRQATVERALRDGMLWYGYGQDHEWLVALELLESAAPDVPRAPVLLVTGSGRGPYRRSLDPVDYLATRCLFLDVGHPDHAPTHVLLEQEEGLWAPLHPAFFDPAALQSELNLLLGTPSADAADPAMDLDPGSPLAQLIHGLPERNASDVRMHVLREGALEEMLDPSDLDEEELRDAVQPYRVMLETLGEAGAPLRWYDKALPEAKVRRVMRGLGTWGLCHDCLGNEQRAWPARKLREQMVRMRLIRVFKGRLVPVKTAWKVHDDPRGLNALVARRAFARIEWPYRLPAFAAALAVADGTEVEAVGLGATFAYGTQFPLRPPTEQGPLDPLPAAVETVREALCFSELCRTASTGEPFARPAGPGSRAVAYAALRWGHLR